MGREAINGYVNDETAAEILECGSKRSADFRCLKL